MDTQELQNKIKELESKLELISNSFELLKNRFDAHSHTETDESLPLRDNIHLNSDKFFSIGGSTLSEYITNINTTSEQRGLVLSTGSDRVDSYLNKSSNMQMNFLHQPNNTSKQSFLTMLRNPAASTLPGQTISVTSGGSTVTIPGFNFVTNELANCLINIVNSSGTLVECQTISSNTNSVITISGTWSASTSNASFLIYVPVFMGSANQIFQRFYTQEGTSGGIRFGVGATNGGQNGLLYMDSTGDIYWRNKSGTSTKLN